jgi:hypothetical protein
MTTKTSTQLVRGSFGIGYRGALSKRHHEATSPSPDNHDIDGDAFTGEELAAAVVDLERRGAALWAAQQSLKERLKGAVATKDMVEEEKRLREQIKQFEADDAGGALEDAINAADLEDLRAVDQAVVRAQLAAIQEQEAIVRREPELAARPRAVQLITGQHVRAAQRAARLFDVATLLLPRRLVNEQLGDALEQINGYANEGKPVWWIRVKTISALFWTAVHALGEIISTVRKPSK